MQTAKLFKSGNSQAVRLPKEHRFSGSEVGIKKVGDTVILFPIEQVFTTFLNGLSGFTEDFLSDYSRCATQQVRESL